MNATRLYFDHAAATPLHPEAREAMVAAFDCWANPNSPYAEARACNALFEKARRSLKAELGWGHDLVFTGGASEAIAICAARCPLEGRIHGATEHDVVGASMGEGSIKLPVDAQGAIDRDALADALAKGPALVAIQQVNNETGVIQDIAAIAVQVHEAGSLLLVDAAQAAGKIDLPDADFIALSGHKLGGPIGVGALLVKDLTTLRAAGGQEKGYRRGTQNVPAAAAFAAAVEAKRYRNAYPRLAALREKLEAAIEARGGTVIAKDAPRTATIGGYSFPGIEAPTLLVQLDLAGVAVSAGSACSSGAMKGSRVVGEMGLPEDVTRGFVRISFGPDTSEADVDALLGRLDTILARARAA
ncbi:cysteine desulfurase family protein [Sphingomicrobium aestuariivivum]|uniref:cysteine desulfurase family protein n=1 Tax=Sphingomicrobium aestuariivivum TaxID=1582356 RepID=UPI001FD6DFA2|nr:aminotransferase class V-fold PLP-dependent enzyme [Sphingomicrobium aestuariivivum]MCJ8189876.1 aminotransferase class V-fold PLP-dependent enzyme [Sphingomicrobium aestuariivivum]